MSVYVALSDTNEICLLRMRFIAFIDAAISEVGSRIASFAMSKYI